MRWGKRMIGLMDVLNSATLDLYVVHPPPEGQQRATRDHIYDLLWHQTEVLATSDSL